MKKLKPVILDLLFLGLSSYIYLFIGDVDRSDFNVLIGIYGILFILLIVYIQVRKSLPNKMLLAFALILRLLFVGNTPNLSDDYYRFVWDGRLLVEDVNPFTIVPARDRGEEVVSKIDPSGELYEGLNSKDKYTVYPPVHQAVFFIGAFFGGGQIQQELSIMQVILIIADLVSIILLFSLLKSYLDYRKKLLFFALNPLLIIEGVGNLHFEGLMISLALLALYLWKNSKLRFYSPIVLSLATAVKLLPLMFLPLIWSKIGLRRFIIYLSVFSLSLILLFLPLLSEELIRGMSTSLDLYFRNFEFNASLYYLLREVGFRIYGYNAIHLIGPLLSLIVLGLAVFLSFKRKWKWEIRLFILSMAYLLCATTVHPWYILPLMTISLFTNFKSAMLWTLLAFLSYSHYQFGFQENYLLISIEYLLLVLVISYDVRFKSLV